MPLLLGLIIVFAAMYQLFFRYDSWPSADQAGVAYEHDNLTGATRLIRPGAKVNVFARLLGQGGEMESTGHRFLEPMQARMGEGLGPNFPQGQGGLSEPQAGLSGSVRRDETWSPERPERIDLRDSRQVEQVARPVPVPREIIVASSSPPVPGNNEQGEEGRPFAVRQVDLDRDGQKEEIIQNANQSDGLLDISIVKNGREIFYGRGKQISLLPTSNRGWSDIALKAGGRTLQVFRYDAKLAAYKVLDHST